MSETSRSGENYQVRKGKRLYRETRIARIPGNEKSRLAAWTSAGTGARGAGLPRLEDVTKPVNEPA
jgi:hypothetical protein